MPEQSLEVAYRELRHRFVASLPEQLALLERLLAEMGEAIPPLTLLEEFHLRIHNLIGIAATFGFPELSERARPLALLARRLIDFPAGRPFPEILGWMRNHLDSLIEVGAECAPALSRPDEATAAHGYLVDLFMARTVFLISDNASLVDHLQRQLDKRGYRLLSFPALSALRQAVHDDKPPSGIVIDLDAVKVEEDAPIVFADKNLVRQTPVPVVVCGSSDDLNHRVRAVRLGSTHFSPHPVDVQRLIRLLTPWTPLKSLEPYRVLLVDDDPILTQFYRIILEEAGITALALNQPARLLEVMEEFQPELVVMDLYMPGVNGIELASVIRQHGQYAALSILFLSAEQNLGRRLSDQQLAHEEVLIKPVRPTALVRAIMTRITLVRARRGAGEHLRWALQELENLQHALNQHAIVSRTDLAGRITYINDKFCEISGYTPAELIGQNHRLIKSDEHSSTFYRDLWHTISQGQVWHGQIKNRRRDGSTYWVEATVVPLLDEQDKPVEYVSIRTEITRQKEAEERARSMALFPELNPAPVLRMDGSGLILEANPAAIHMLGIRREGGCHLHELLPETEILDFAQCIRNDDTISFGAHLGERFFHFTVQGVSPLGVAHIFGSDITELRRIKEAMEVAKEYTENLINSSLDMIIAVDSERRITEFNPAAVRTFGYRREEILGQHIDILYVDREESGKPRFLASAAGEFKGEVRNKKKNGEIFYSYLSSAPVRDREGQLIGYMGISRDITERRMAEEVLRENEELIRAIVASALEGILVADSQGTIELFNPAAEKIFGYSSREVMGRNLAMLMPPHYADHHDQYMANYLQTGEKKVIGRSREVEGERKDGTLVPLSLSVSEFRLGNKHMFTGVVSDITERKEAERELLLAKEMAEKANRAKSEFLSGMSHELRTPMNAVLGFSQLLESDPLEPLSESQRDSVREIIQAGNHLLHLINEVLDLAKIESGKVQITLEEVALWHVVDECLHLVASLAKSHDVTIEKIGPNCRCEEYLVRADRVRLKQVVLNLLSNAIKYNKKNGQILLCCTPLSPERVQFQVRDTGIGIPPEKLHAVFEPFNRLGAEHSGVEGTGMGLVIAKRLVEYMGGAIQVESRPGEGSTFQIELVTLDTIPFSQSMEEPTMVAESFVSRPQAASLLYIEDTPANIKLVERLLHRRTGVELLAAPSPVLGLDLAVDRHPDVILLDIQLPGMDGYEVLKRLQNNPATSAIPVIAISANAMPADVEQGLAAGFLRYLTKPINVEAFMEALETALGFSRPG